jgi:phage tail sheath gpL-like
MSEAEYHDLIKEQIASGADVQLVEDRVEGHPVAVVCPKYADVMQAAPDLLAAARTAKRAIEDDAKVRGIHPQEIEAYCNLCDAINKATPDDA